MLWKFYLGTLCICCHCAKYCEMITERSGHSQISPMLIICPTLYPRLTRLFQSVLQSEKQMIDVGLGVGTGLHAISLPAAALQNLKCKSARAQSVRKSSTNLSKLTPTAPNFTTQMLLAGVPRKITTKEWEIIPNLILVLTYTKNVSWAPPPLKNITAPSVWQLPGSVRWSVDMCMGCVCAFCRRSKSTRKAMKWVLLWVNSLNVVDSMEVTRRAHGGHIGQWLNFQ